MKQYLDMGKRLLEHGVMVENKRTGKQTLTIIGETFSHEFYEFPDGSFSIPIVTTKKLNWKVAIAELLGYLKGCNSSAQFRELGCKTWDANANENSAWLANPHRKGEDDMGRVYGAQGRDWRKPDGSGLDQLAKIVNNLKNNYDDRGEILTFYNPGEFEMGCLRPCMHTHQFSLLDGKLHIESYQRSSDFALGQPFNHLQVAVLVILMAQITGYKPARMRHHLTNVHLYEDQIDIFKDVQAKRTPTFLPQLKVNPKIKTLEDLDTWVTVDDFEVINYNPKDAIKYPFSV